jgi:SAM-dependent methyltransferase
MHFASYYRWLVATQYWGLPLEYDLPVLDIGGDDGEFLSRIQAPFKVGLDIVARPEVPFQWLLADGRCLPFAGASFGNVFAFDVIEHIEDDRAMLHEACRLLKPGGTMWLSTTANDFSIFPGGGVQRRFEQSWGHARRGYSAAMLRARLPAGVDLNVWTWNEPALRRFYVLLYAMRQIHPPTANQFAIRLLRSDAKRREGCSGHLFVRISKVDSA